MSTTSKLIDTHLVILGHAARHPQGRVLPLPVGTGNKGGAGTRALKSLLRRHLIQEEIARPEDQEWARAENGERLALTITPAGLAAIGVSEGGEAEEPVTNSAAPKSASQVSQTSTGATADPPMQSSAPARRAQPSSNCSERRRALHFQTW